MPLRTRHRLLWAAAIASLAYNLAWVVSARPLVAMICVAERSLVEGDAHAAEKQQRWLDAAHRYYYLANYSGRPGSACSISDEYGSAPALPFVALTLWALHPDFPSGVSAKHRGLLEQSYSRSLNQAVSHLSSERSLLPLQASEAD